MVAGKRIVALIVMALMSTASPAVYQKAIQPREAGFNCEIQINSLKIDGATYNTENMIVFDAYISIHNLAGVPAVLSRLDLDVYHLSSSLNRYIQIGTFNTSQEYTIDAGATLEGPNIYGLLTLVGNSDPSKSPSNEAFAALIRSGSVPLKFKGTATAGPLTFSYERDITLYNSFFDPNLIISDLWNFNSQPSLAISPQGNDTNILVARVKLHNPSSIPMTFQSYSFDLKYNGVTIATGVPMDTLFASYDPDLQSSGQRSDLSIYESSSSSSSKLGSKNVYLPETNQWEDMLLGFNFTDPSLSREDYGSTTLPNLNWFMTQLFTQPSIDHLQLVGRDVNITIGNVVTLGNREVIRGIEVELGGQGSPSPLIIDDVSLHQQFYKASNENLPNNLNKDPVSLMQLMTVGQMNVSAIDISRATNMVTMQVNATVNFTNPYRLQFNFQSLNTSYYQVSSDHNTYTDLAKAAFLMYQVPIDRAIVNNITTTDRNQAENITFGVTQIPQLLTIRYNTSDYNNTGIAKMFTDLGIDIQTLNFTNPLWLLGPNGFNVDPTVLIAKLISSNIDPLMMLQSVNTAYSYHYGADAYFPLRASSFGENGVAWDPTSYPYTKSTDLPVVDAPNSNGFFNAPLIRSSYDDVDGYFNTIPSPQYLIFRQLTYNTAWQNNWPNDVNTQNFFAGYVSNYFPKPAGSSADYLPSPDLMAWRVYTDTNTGLTYSWWGYKYDALDNLNPSQSISTADLHNWFIVHDNGGGNMLFRQNFTLNTAVLRSPNDIKYANLSISYRYPDTIPMGNGTGRIGIGYYSNNEYQYVGESQDAAVWDNHNAALQGYFLSPPSAQGTQNQWTHRTIDVTSIVNQTFYKYVIDYRNYLMNYTSYLQNQLASISNPATLSIDSTFGTQDYNTRDQDHINRYNAYTNTQALYQSALETITHNWNNSLDLNVLEGYELGYLAALQAYVSAYIAYKQPIASFVPFANDRSFINDLKMEVSFACIGSPEMFFDDVYLEIDYMDRSEQKFQIQDLFNYLQQNNPQMGNAYTLLDKISFDPVSMMNFIESDNGISPSGTSQGADIINYLAASNTELTNIISLFQDSDQYGKIDSGQPLNFLQMLNSTEYTIRPLQYGETTTPTPYGPRMQVQQNGWVVQDPYALSRALIQELKNNTFADPYKGTTYPNMVGNELWTMFENMHVLLPWIIVYLYMHGWTKNDIFDALEAAGFSKEVKQNFLSNQYSDGNVTENVQVSSHININNGLATLDPLSNVGMQLVVPMASPINASLYKLYNYLSYPIDRTVFSSGRALDNAQLITLEGSQNSQLTLLGFIPFTLHTDETLTITVNSYTVGVKLHGIQGSHIYPWHMPTNPYVQNAVGGLNDLGVQTLTNLMRQTIAFNGAPFMKMAGDPLGLFSFLDQYFFNDPQTTYHGYVDSYSSYTLLNYFGVNAADFFDIIGGFNPDSGKNVFDANGNGRADDWRAPCQALTGVSSSYQWTSVNVKPTWYNPTSRVFDPLNGWGNDFNKNRIYWDPLNSNNPDNGYVMWTDSPDLLNDPSGIITDPVVSQNFTDGAPPCVNLIDMLAWLSQTTGLVDAKSIFNWLEGKLSPGNYIVQRADDSATPGQCLDYNLYNHGIGLQKVWEALSNGTFNVTGWFNWMANVQKVDPYELMYQLNNWPGLTAGTGSPDAMSIFYMMQTPNYIQQGDGAVEWIYHHGIAGMSATSSQSAFWNFFNGSWWADFGNMPSYWDISDPWGTLPGRILAYINNTLSMGQIQAGVSGSNRSFDFFQMLINLGVLPEDWVNALQNESVKPFELLAVYDVMNFTKLFNDASIRNASTTVMINGSFNLQMYDITFNSSYAIPFGVAPTAYSAAVDLPNFMDPSRFYAPYGTYSYHV